MLTRIFNLLVVLLGVAAAFGYKIDLSTEQITAIAGALAALGGAVNQAIHEIEARKAPPDPPRATP